MTTCPHCKKEIEDGDHGYLERFIDILFALILGFSISVFSKEFQLDSFSSAWSDIGRTLLFVSAIFLVIYDWFAYHLLIRKLPYKEDHYFVRFIVDLVIFYLMYMLFVTVTKSTETYVLTIAGLFMSVLIWHVLAYFQYKGTDNKNVTVPGMKSSSIGAGLFILSYFLLRNMSDQVNIHFINIIVAVFVIGYCVIRFICVVNKDIGRCSGQNA